MRIDQSIAIKVLTTFMVVFTMHGCTTKETEGHIGGTTIHTPGLTDSFMQKKP